MKTYEGVEVELHALVSLLHKWIYLKKYMYINNETLQNMGIV